MLKLTYEVTVILKKKVNNPIYKIKPTHLNFYGTIK